jgi:hypothetical protein
MTWRDSAAWCWSWTSSAGERRQHPLSRLKVMGFPVGAGTSLRYNTSIQHLIGDSLAGWMAWDLSRGVDLLARQRSIPADRLMGSVAGRRPRP